METFKIRPYTKKELALQYFPDSQPRTAVNHLMAWNCRCPSLMDQLQMASSAPLLAASYLCFCKKHEA